jgi:hypothetical protein
MVASFARRSAGPALASARSHQSPTGALADELLKRGDIWTAWVAMRCARAPTKFTEGYGLAIGARQPSAFVGEFSVAPILVESVGRRRQWRSGSCDPLRGPAGVAFAPCLCVRAWGSSPTRRLDGAPAGWSSGASVFGECRQGGDGVPSIGFLRPPRWTLCGPWSRCVSRASVRSAFVVNSLSSLARRHRRLNSAVRTHWPGVVPAVTCAPVC